MEELICKLCDLGPFPAECLTAKECSAYEGWFLENRLVAPDLVVKEALEARRDNQ